MCGILENLLLLGLIVVNIQILVSQEAYKQLVRLEIPKRPNFNVWLNISIIEVFVKYLEFPLAALLFDGDDEESTPSSYSIHTFLV